MSEKCDRLEQWFVELAAEARKNQQPDDPT
jgi:hypothetical protein